MSKHVTKQAKPARPHPEKPRGKSQHDKRREAMRQAAMFQRLAETFGRKA